MTAPDADRSLNDVVMELEADLRIAKHKGPLCMRRLITTMVA